MKSEVGIETVDQHIASLKRKIDDLEEVISILRGAGVFSDAQGCNCLRCKTARDVAEAIKGKDL